MLQVPAEKSYRKHLVGFVKNEHLHGVGLEVAPLNHVLNTAWSTNDDVRTVLQSFHVVPHARTANASMTFDAKEIAQSNNNFLDLLCKLTSRSKDEGLTGLDAAVDFL